MVAMFPSIYLIGLEKIQPFGKKLYSVKNIQHNINTLIYVKSVVCLMLKIFSNFDRSMSGFNSSPNKNHVQSKKTLVKDVRY